MRILLGDDHAVIRKGLRTILAEEFGPVDIGEASNASEIMDCLAADPWDILILDISMPGRSGFETLKDVKALYPAVPVLMLSMHTEEQYAVRTLRAGASGYLMKDAAPEELGRAVRRVLDGRKYVSQSLAEQLAGQLDASSDRPLHAALSDREYQVLTMIASGKTPNEIASSLSLSVKTVSTYRTRLLEKLSMHSNAELTHYAVENKLM